MKDNLNIKADCKGMDRFEIIETILGNRGIDNEIEFLNVTENDLIPFENMKNLEKGFDTLYDSIFANYSKNDKILIHADVDVDGLCSYSIVYQYLLNYMPENRIKSTINKGKVHGIEDYDLDKLHDVDLMIIVDSINDIEDYCRILETGTKVLILDHHISSKELIEFEKNNENICLISSANEYDNPQLSGSGVVWKFCKYFDYATLNDFSEKLIDLAMTGIIADMCDVSADNKENRYICYKGITNIKNPALKTFSKGYAFNGETVTYGIAPLINAAMRMLKNNYVLNIFNLKDNKEIKNKIEHLKECKQQQAEEVDKLLAIAEIKDCNKIAIATIEDNKYNLKGLIANKITADIQKPLLCVSEYIKDNEHYYSGSARGTGVENFLKDIENTKCIEFAKGHENAFGVKIDCDNITECIEKLNNLYKNIEFENRLNIDAEIETYQITADLINDIERISVVTGEGYKPYKFLVRLNNFQITTIKGIHIKIESGGVSFIKWNDNNIEKYVNKNIVVIGTLSKSVFKGKIQKQMIIEKIIVED